MRTGLKEHDVNHVDEHYNVSGFPSQIQTDEGQLPNTWTLNQRQVPPPHRAIALWKRDDLTCSCVDMGVKGVYTEARNNPDIP